MSYINDLQEIQYISFDKILKLAKDYVPANRKNNPWIGIDHGVKLLTNDDELSQYIAAYGSMHRDKLNIALDSIPNPKDYKSKNITIIDWGCGQGLATICFYDYMRKIGIEPSVDRIILIEPSSAAINRAKLHLSKYTDAGRISLVNKFIDDVTLSDIETSKGSVILHFFSNILDIDSVHLDRLSELIKKGIVKEQLFFCVGPLNSGASRISDFVKLFNIKQDDLIGSRNGRINSNATISMITFRILSNISEVIKVEYYRQRRVDLGNNTALRQILSHLNPSADEPDKAIQFYRAIVELERFKSTTVTDVFYYPYALETCNNTVKFNIDIQDNPDFELSFIDNLNTKWPKHLNIGLNILWNDTVFRLFEYVYPFEDLKAIDITKQYISVNLSMFTISGDVADKLELTDDIIDVIIDVLTNQGSTLHEVESILKDAIGHNLTLYPQLSLSLTAEAPALSQINSELKNLSLKKDDNNLITSFLTDNIGDNIVDNVSEDDIINVVSLDDSQRKAIATALNSKVSVITGPPGTGKTQMIVNLIANALLKTKSVLIVSKNNKAVDNITERFNKLDQHQYLLRFGSRDMISNKLIPQLESLCSAIPRIEFNKSSLTEKISNYNLQCTEALLAREQLSELVRLTDCQHDLELKLDELMLERQHIESDYRKSIETLHSTYKQIVEISQIKKYDWNSLSSDIQKDIDILYSKDKGLSKFFFNLFSKKKYAIKIWNRTLSLPVLIKELVQKESGIRCLSDIQNCNQLIQVCEIELRYLKLINEYIDKLFNINSKYKTAVNNNERRIKDIQQNLDINNKKIKELENNQDNLLKIISLAREYISSIIRDLLTGLINVNLTTPDTLHSLARYKNYLPDNIPWKEQDRPIFVQDARKFIKSFRLNSVTSLSVKSAYPLDSELFDILIVDEASQCDIASALPLLYRAKQVVVIGDPLQLKHITSVTNIEERIIKEYLSLNENPFLKYVEYSLWDYCNALITSANKNNQPIVLDCHYRCHQQIIGYSNEMFYQRKLGIPLKVCTKKENIQLPYSGIIWEDIVGNQTSDIRNINEAEIKQSIKIACKFADDYPNISIGIISPFKHQAKEIYSNIPNNYHDRIVAGTVHEFQGDERDVIIYSTVVTDNSPESKIRWIDKKVPNLVNVAVTRARQILYIVGNRRYIKSHSNKNLPLGYLVEYTERKSHIHINISESVIVDTAILVDHPDILSKLDSSKQIILSSKVMDDLNKLKVNSDISTRRNAEIALRNISNLSNIRSIRMEYANLEYLPRDYDCKNPDNMILSIAIKYRNQNPLLLTANNSLRLKAKGLGIQTISIKEIF